MNASTLRQVRQVHNYLAVFFAPAILFFAFTGGLQTLGLHESHGDAPAPPRWIAAIASLHKHQVIAGPRHKPATDGDHRPGSGAPANKPGGDHDDHDHGGLSPLKLFVLLLSAALFVTTALGLVIALTNRASRRLSLVLTIAGVAVPLLLLL